jgi:hypothetical protein
MFKSLKDGITNIYETSQIISDMAKLDKVENTQKYKDLLISIKEKYEKKLNAHEVDKGITFMRTFLLSACYQNLGDFRNVWIVHHGYLKLTQQKELRI